APTGATDAGGLDRRQYGLERLLDPGLSIVLNASRNPALHRLEQATLLASRWVAAESGRRRQVYTLTRRGERALAGHCVVWQQFSNAIGGVLAGARTSRKS